MLTQKMVQEIQDLKARGYSLNEIVRHYEGQNGKGPSLPTIRKYYRMNGMPDDPNANLGKDRAFDRPPYREAVIEILNGNGPKCRSSSVYDVLIERFVESGATESLPGNEQTLRNYVKHLRDSKAVDMGEACGRTYEYVFDTPPGEQMLLDFGEQRIAPGARVHFLCMLLRHSRMICVFAQDHRFSSEEACRAIYMGFAKLGGRPKKLVIDQDPVFVASETYGEVVEARAFRDFCMEQELQLWVCNKADPESKGPIENVVGFVKKNYFSARMLAGIEEVLDTLPGWVERKNRRIHQATFRVPLDIFEEFEKSALRPMLPSFYESSPSSFTCVEIKSMPYVQYKSSKYSVPRKHCFGTVCYKAVAGRLHIFDEGREYICSHAISECRGSVNRLDEHKREPSGDWLAVAEGMRQKWNCYDFQHFINGFKKENPRHLYSQLSAVSRLLDAERPAQDVVSETMKVCCENFRYRFSQFAAVYEQVKAGRASRSPYICDDVQRQSMDVYGKAFADRCEGGAT
jgi:hypothetical protein